MFTRLGGAAASFFGTSCARAGIAGRWREIEGIIHACIEEKIRVLWVARASYLPSVAAASSLVSNA